MPRVLLQEQEASCPTPYSRQEVVVWGAGSLDGWLRVFNAEQVSCHMNADRDAVNNKHTASVTDCVDSRLGDRLWLIFR